MSREHPRRCLTSITLHYSILPPQNYWKPQATALKGNCCAKLEDERKGNQHMRQGIGQMFVLTGLLLITSLIGCSARGSGNSPDSSSLLVGRWRQTSIATAKQSANCPATLPLPGGSTTSCSGKDEIEFNSNGTFTATFSGSPVKGSGTWRLNGNTLLLTFTAPPNVADRSQSTTIIFGAGGKTININAKLGDTPITETYTRQ